MFIWRSYLYYKKQTNSKSNTTLGTKLSFLFNNNAHYAQLNFFKFDITKPLKTRGYVGTEMFNLWINVVNIRIYRKLFGCLVPCVKEIIFQLCEAFQKFFADLICFGFFFKWFWWNRLLFSWLVGIVEKWIQIITFYHVTFDRCDRIAIASGCISLR